MIKRQVTLTKTVDLLNSLLKIDRKAMSELLQTRVKCNKKLGDHPTVQVYLNKKENQDYVGLLGILNGLFGIADDGFGAIGMNLDDNNLITKFKIIR